MPAGVVTVTFTTPVPAGAVRRDVGCTDGYARRRRRPELTAVAVVKPVPVRGYQRPADGGPLVGLRAQTVGRSNNGVRELIGGDVADAEGVVTVTSTCWFPGRAVRRDRRVANHGDSSQTVPKSTAVAPVRFVPADCSRSPPNVGPLAGSGSRPRGAAATS